ncbi:MAG: hypothetical protein IT367_05585 [Candidatus Hydrogenedentes bacterium]|nr:hypothetical protein [Candidatus Hydrogenedentota bacterium]
MTVQHQSRSGCGRIFLILFGIAFFAVMGVLIWFVYSSQSMNETIRAKGEPVTLAELDAWYTAVPDDENAALVVLMAADVHSAPPADAPIPLHMERTRLDERIAWKSGEPMPEVSKRATAEFLKANHTCLEIIADIDALTKSRYPVVARTVLGGRLTHLAEIRNLARLVVIDAIYKAETGDTAGACASLERAVRLSETLKNEPFLISQLVRVACHSLAVTGIEHVVNRVPLQADELERLQKLIEAAEDPNLLYRAVAGERCFSTDPINAVGGVNAIVPLLLATPNARLLTQVVEASRLTGAKRRDEFTRIQKVADASFNPYAAILLPTFDRTHETHDRDVAMLRVAATVLAIERHRLSEGNIPDSLTALVPKFLNAITVDPFDEQPIRFVRGNFGYSVYSIGTNIRDEQGAEPNIKSRETGDIVIKVTHADV